MRAEVKTYTSNRTNPLAMLREAYNLYRIKSRDIPGQVAGAIWLMRRCEERIRAATGIALENKDVLIIGPGQTPREMVCLGMRNNVVGIDLDVIPNNWQPGSYYAMLRRNGAMRVIKTIARRMLGLDARFRRELMKQLGITQMPKMSYLQMDAAHMTFAPESFDFVYSFSVFEHLPDPASALDEVVRVLRPNGGCCISVHQYCSEEGCHDLRLFAEDRSNVPFWPHLRPRYAHLVRPNAYLNALRYHQWLDLFRDKMPEAVFQFDTHDPQRVHELKQALQSIRAEGELAEYTDEELLTVNIVAIWQKPGVTKTGHKRDEGHSSCGRQWDPSLSGDTGGLETTAAGLR